jgi:hypothetical protein
MWDVQQVLDCMSSADVDNISLLPLSRHTAMLLALLSGKRGQSIHAIKLGDIHVTGNTLRIASTTVVKQTRPGIHDHDIYIPTYPADHNLCALYTLRAYVTKTKPLRKNVFQLFIQTNKPHKAVSRSTISRWIKDLMLQAGIPPDYQARSTRGASTSASTAPLQTILEAAGWAKESTFRAHYKLPVERRTMFAANLLAARPKEANVNIS